MASPASSTFTPEQPEGWEAIDYFYRKRDSDYIPTGVGFSPWNNQAQNGVALAGLAAHLLDQVPSLAPMHPARIQIDLLGAVPMKPLRPHIRIVREGTRIQNVELELRHADRAWVRATMLRVRTVETPEISSPPTHAFPEEPPSAIGRLAFIEGHRCRGSWNQTGPGAMWLRTRIGVVEGQALCPLELLVMAADFGTGTAPLLPRTQWNMANVELSLHLTRQPVGEWILLDAISESSGNGIGLNHVRLGDRHGMMGFSHQTLFLEPRQP